jgi:hypothetical protein
MAVTRANAYPANLQDRNTKRGIDITSATTAEVRITSQEFGLREQAIEP